MTVSGDPSGGNTFHNKGDGEQNIAQGDHAVGKRIDAQGGSIGIIGNGADVHGGIHYGVPPELLTKYAEELGETKQIIKGFLGTLLKEEVPRDRWDAKLREIAATHKELLARLATVQSEDPEVVRLKGEARQAIEAGEYAKAEDLLNRAEARDVQAIEQAEEAARQQLEAARQRRISAAATNAEQAELQRVQLRYAEAAEYWRKAAGLLPEGEKKDRSLYLSNAGYDLHRIARYSEALPLYEQSLALYREIGDRAGEGATLNNISQIYDARGEYATALTYLEQSLAIPREIGDRAGEGTTLNNIGEIHRVRGDYDKALPLYKQSLAIFREIGAKSQQGTLLNNISLIYDARGEYDTALTYLEQSLAISKEIGDRAGEAVTSWNIGYIYRDQGDLAEAEQYMARTVEIDEAIGRPELEWERAALEALRAEIKGM